MLFWETVGFISPSSIKLRIKSTEGLLSETNEGIQLFNVVESSDTSQIVYNEFRWSLGFGQQNFNYDDFFGTLAAHPDYSDKFASFGNGIGAVKDRDKNLMTYMNSVAVMSYESSWRVGNDVRVANIYWETYDVSCIVEIYIPNWTTTLNASQGQGFGNIQPIYTQILPNIFGDAGFLNYDHTEDDAILFSDIDGYNILISTTLKLGNIKIEPVTNNTLQNFTLFAPVHFTDSIYDFNLTFANISTPTSVDEASTAVFQLDVQSNDYAGGVELFLLDKNTRDSVNQEIGNEIEQFYGTIENDVVAQYGNLKFTQNNSHKIATTISKNEILNFNIEYNADNVSAGQQDTFAIFVRYNNLNTTIYSDDLFDASYQFNLLPIAQKYIYSDNLRISVLDTQEEFIEAYDPSENIITQPSDVVHHILSEELGFDKNKIDTASKIQSRNVHQNYELGFSVHEEIEGKKLIQEICKSTQMVATLSSDKLKFVNIQDTYDSTESIATIKANDVLSYKFTRTPLEDIKTQVEVKYEKDYGVDRYLSSTDEMQVDTNNYFLSGKYGNYVNATIESENYYGIESDNDEINHLNTMLVYESDYIRNANTADRLAKYLLEWNKNQHNIVTLKLPLKYYGLEIGDLVEFDQMIHNKKVYNETYVFDNPDDMPIRCGQYILPLFIITETKKTVNGVNLKATQLHHMSDSILNYKGYQYPKPVIQTPEEVQTEYNVLDVVQAVNFLVNNIELTETEFQKYDINNDGLVDVLDIVSIVLEIINE